jgi:hypothetical protein
MSIELLGAVQSPPDSNDYQFVSLLTPEEKVVALPPRFSSTPVPPRIAQEGGTCTAASTTHMRYQQQRTDLGVWVPLSYKDLYAHQKRIDGIDGEGSTLRASMQVLKNYGQGIEKPGGNPAKNKTKAYYAIERNPDAIKRAIFTYAGGVVVAGPWADEWMRTGPSGVLPQPKNHAGGHAFFACGYDDIRKALICLQSWPLPWGYNGRGVFFLPYEFITDHEWGLWEAWRTVDLPHS